MLQAYGLPGKNETSSKIKSKTRRGLHGCDADFADWVCCDGDSATDPSPRTADEEKQKQDTTRIARTFGRGLRE
jgi:hypothetical protein